MGTVESHLENRFYRIQFINVTFCKVLKLKTTFITTTYAMKLLKRGSICCSRYEPKRDVIFRTKVRIDVVTYC